MARLFIHGGQVVDPLNRRLDFLDLVIDNGRIEAVGHGARVPAGAQVIDAAGALVMPGLVDTHTHVAGHYRRGHAMMARAGVTTALNLSGHMDDVIEGMRQAGAGLNVASLESLAPGDALPNDAPSPAEIRMAIEAALGRGAIGVKILGGHYPFTPDATAEIIHAANELRCYVAFHVGSTRYGSNLEGLREAAELADGNAMQVAHVNSYCRGAILPAIDEAREAIEILTRWPRLRSESYLALINGTSGRCIQGSPASNATSQCLTLFGYDATEEGLERAFDDGRAYVLDDRGDSTIHLRGTEARDLWREMGTDVSISFPINDPTSQFILATARHPDGRYVVDALSTDGGGIPRNVTVERGLALVDLDGLSLTGFVTKAALAPARMLGLTNKGHLTPGADADVIVVDRANRRVRATIVGGEVAQVDGVVTGSGGTLIAGDRGRVAAERTGIPVQTIDVARTGLYEPNQVAAVAALR
ncbi:MAG: amidohydrolase family protein [Chloroflexota bacterium]